MPRIVAFFCISLSLTFGLSASYPLNFNEYALSDNTNSWLAHKKAAATKPISSIDAIELTMLAELAKDRGMFHESIEYYLQATKISQDRKIAKLTTELALSINLYKQAQIAARIWYENSPNDLFALAKYIEITLNLNEPKLTQNLLKILLQNPKEPMLSSISFIGQSLENKNSIHNFKQAILTLNKNNSKNINVQLLTVEGLIAINDIKSALKFSNKIIKLAPNDEYASYLHTKLLYNENKIKQAVMFSKKFVDTHTNNPMLTQLLAEILLDINQTRAAKYYLEKLALNTEYTSVAELYLGQIHLTYENYTQAVLHFKKVLKDPEQKITATFLLGKAFELQKDNKQAIYWYAQVSPSRYYIEARLSAAKLLSEQKKLTESINLLKQTHIQTEHELSQVCHIESSILMQHKKFDEAVGTLNRCIKLLPNDVELVQLKKQFEAK